MCSQSRHVESPVNGANVDNAREVLFFGYSSAESQCNILKAACLLYIHLPFFFLVVLKS